MILSSRYIYLAVSLAIQLRGTYILKMIIILLFISAALRVSSGLELAYIQVLTRHGARTNFVAGSDPLHTDYSPLELNDLTPAGMR